MNRPSALIHQHAVGLAVFGILFSFASLDTALAASSVKEALQQIERHVNAHRSDEALAAARQLAAQGGVEAAEALFRVGLVVESPKLYKGIAEILAGMKADGPLELFRRGGFGKTEAQGVYAAEILGAMGGAGAAEILQGFLSSPHLPVQRTAIASLAKVRHRVAVSALLQLVEKLDKAKDRGLLYQEARDALYDATGMDFDSLVDWRKWWDPVRETWEPEKAGAREGKTTARKPRDTAAEFAGRKIFSRCVIFIIDSSGTMQYVLKDDIPGLTWYDGSDRGKVMEQPKKGLTPENSILVKWWSRLEVAKRELLKALEGLGPESHVNIIEFNKVVKPFEKKLTKLDPKVKSGLLRRARNLAWVTAAGTDTFGALEKGIQCDPRVTEIFFLSDGLPSADGKTNDDPLPILDKLESLNRFRKIKVHTFGYDPTSLRKPDEPYEDLMRANEFLEQVAERTAGTFTLLKATDEKPPKGWR